MRAIKLASKEPSDYELYADALAQGGNLEGATAVLKQGTALDLYYLASIRTSPYCPAAMYCNARS
ncbi:MAG: hypothetical protein P8Z30_20325 [Acidobacteriota bacterium]